MNDLNTNLTIDLEFPFQGIKNETGFSVKCIIRLFHGLAASSAIEMSLVDLYVSMVVKAQLSNVNAYGSSA